MKKPSKKKIKVRKLEKIRTTRAATKAGSEAF